MTARTHHAAHRLRTTRHDDIVRWGDAAHELGELLVALLAALLAVAGIGSVATAVALTPTDIATGWRVLLGLGVAAIMAGLIGAGLVMLTAPRPADDDAQRRAEQAWEAAKLDIPRHDAEFDRTHGTSGPSREDQR